ncbi:transcriptional regulator, LuxR family protein [Rhodobacteraceae bacterium KLH11]|nr:transcriptional regulator, LuxR family protein [Rhodobacteraceae bacterium KLH11]
MSWTHALPNLYGTINALPTMSDALDGVAREVSAKGAMFVVFNEVGFEFSEHYSSSVWSGKEDKILEYSQKYQALEQDCWRQILATPFGKPVTDFDIWPEGHDMRVREDVQFIIDLVGIYRRVAYNLSPAMGWKSGFIFHYADNEPELPLRTFDLSQNFMPHLAKVSELLRFVSTLRRRYNAIYGAIDKINVGMVVFDILGRIVITNDAADRIFSQADGLGRVNGKLLARDSDAQSELTSKLRLIAATSQGENAKSEAILTVPRPSGLSDYTLVISPLMDGGEEIESRFCGSLAFIFDTANPPKIDITPLETLAKLSPSEADTTALLLKGHTDREIAEIRNVTYETARTQIKRVLEKSGVANRPALVRKAAMINPPTS